MRSTKIALLVVFTSLLFSTTSRAACEFSQNPGPAHIGGAPGVISADMSQLLDKAYSHLQIGSQVLLVFANQNTVHQIAHIELDEKGICSEFTGITLDNGKVYHIEDILPTVNQMNINNANGRLELITVGNQVEILNTWWPFVGQKTFSKKITAITFDGYIVTDDGRLMSARNIQN